jgi:hypothetical protein
MPPPTGVCPLAAFSAIFGGRSLRLSGGGSTLEGRLEVFGAQTPGGPRQWGLIHHEGWDARDAHVACRTLGFATGRVVIYAGWQYGTGLLPFVLTGVDCKVRGPSLR